MNCCCVGSRVGLVAGAVLGALLPFVFRLPKSSAETPAAAVAMPEP